MAQFDDGALALADVEQAQSKPVMCGDRRRIERRTSSVARERVAELQAPVQRDAERELRVGDGGVERGSSFCARCDEAK